MEHILQFAISIDDKTIQQKIETAALKQLSDELTKSVKGIIFEKDSWGRVRDNGCYNASGWTKDRFAEFLETHKDEILKEAAHQLAEKLSRTKAAKELIGKAVED